MSFRFSNLAQAGMLTTESPLRDLAAIIRSRTPLIAVESNEEMQIVRLVRQIGQQFQLKTFRWTVTEGMQAFDPYDQPQQPVLKSQEILSYIKTASNCLFVLLDFQPYLQDNVHVRFLKDIALTCSKNYSTVVLVGGTLQIPEDLRPFTAYFRLPLPTPDQLRGIVYDVAGEWGAEHGHREVETTNKALDLLVHNLAGLTATDARRLALKAINDNGVISESELPEVMRAKYELLGRDSPLSFEYETAQFAEIGGMQRLRQWLEARKSFFRDHDAPEPLDPPRGLLLLGVQGCGKSLAAKAAAGIFGVPLLRLDFGVLYNKYYGETERNLRKALETAEVMAPCVLWLDEIEKGLATGEEDGGVSRRVLGALLTWMSERKKTVFVVATANDILRLPPEMVRKGRFDEVFFVDMPSPENRRGILEIHLRKRRIVPADFDLAALAAATEGFSGAEIEQAIVSAIYTARAQYRELSQEDLLAEIEQTRPLSVLMAEQVQELRDWAVGRTVSCD
jgi:hypothetical protein